MASAPSWFCLRLFFFDGLLSSRWGFWVWGLSATTISCISGFSVGFEVSATSEFEGKTTFLFWEDCAVGFSCFCDDSISLRQELAELNKSLMSSNDKRFRNFARGFLCRISSQSKSRNTMMIICQLGKRENWQGNFLHIGNISRRS